MGESDVYMDKFIDIHCHILPGVDDGAKDLAQALELVKIAQDDGTGALVLTPHYRGRFRQNTPEQLRAAFDALRQAAPKDMELFLGNEVAYEKDVAEKLTEGRVLSLSGGRYVLLEFDVATTGYQAMDAVMELIGSGAVPVIAHVERYPVFQKDKQLTEAVLAAGALIQINADFVSNPIKTFSSWYRYDARYEDGDSIDGEFYMMPIFDERQFKTLVTLYDGETVLLTGMAVDTNEIVHDKIPILGDIPFIGRFFQSRYTKATKSNLLVFATCRLVKADGTPLYPSSQSPHGEFDFGRNY